MLTEKIIDKMNDEGKMKNLWNVRINPSTAT